MEEISKISEEMGREEPLFEGEYSIPREVFVDALNLYQKKVTSKRHLVFQIVFLLLGVYYIYTAITSKSTLSYVLAAICAAFLFLLWYNPRKQKKSILYVFDEVAADVYRCSVYDDRTEIETIMTVNEGKEETPDLRPSIIHHEKKTKVLEGENYIICGNEIRFYVIPDSAFGEKAGEVREFYKAKLYNS